MILGFIITNRDGNLLFSKSTDYSGGDKFKPRDFVKHTQKNLLVLECLIKIETNYFLCVKENDLRITICFQDTDNTVSPLFVQHKIQRCIKLCSDYVGEFKESNFVQNFGLVCDIFTDVIDDCEFSSRNYAAIWDSKQQDASLLSMLPSNLFGSKSVNESTLIAPSESSKQPLSQMKNNNSEADSLFVDLLEEIEVIVSDNGAVLFSNITGKMLIKSYSSQTVSLSVSMGDNLKYGNENHSEILSTGTLMSHCQFEDKIDHKEFPKSLKMVAEQGSNPILNYAIRTNSIKLPFTMYSSTKINSKNMILLDLKFHCNAEAAYAPINFKASMPLPSNTVSLSAKSSLHSITFDHNRQESVLNWTSDLIAGQSHHSVTITISVLEITDLTLLELSSVNLRFEMPSICVSGIRITNVKIQNNLSKPIKKWARCLTHTKNYQFMLNHQRLQDNTTPS